MYFFLLILVLLAVIIYLAFTRPAELIFELDSDRSLLCGSFSWLSALRAIAEPDGSRLRLTIFLFEKKVASKIIVRNGKRDHTIFRALSLHDTHISTSYGMNQPHETGILCGLMALLGTFIRADSFEQNAQFIPDHEYVRMRGSSSLHLGKTMANLIRLKSEQRKRGNYHGTVKFN